jgi:AcrR family transcriptional regulator
MVVTDKGSETRQRILDVAAHAFAEYGYSGISLNDVIRRTGLTKGGFYFHFDSKSALALAVLDHLRDRSRNRALATAAQHPRAVDQIEAIIREVVATKVADSSMAALGRICQELGSAEPHLRDQLGHFEGWFTTSEQLFRAAQDEGSMDPSIDVERAAWFMVTSFVGADFVSDLRGDNLTDYIDTYIDHAFRAVGLQRSRPQGAPR